MSDVPHLYRYEDQMYSGVSISVDGYESYYPIGPEINLRKFDVARCTPQGFWIRYYCPKNSNIFSSDPKKWISNYSRKRFAHPTKEEALESFKYRKRKQISILTKQLERAKSALEKAKEIKL